ncbi:hypothetical protein V5799_032076 [Amblyomma americanum]|uniref:Uncharacterized protein n=1 Tax=Amblyomma americanum TaxID=6943 RepID=A0AAQ4DS76_AMBAM
MTAQCCDVLSSVKATNTPARFYQAWINRMTAVLSAILPARNSSQARNPTHRPPFTALTFVASCQHL